MKRINSKKRGVAVVISTLLILAITATGAVLVSNMIDVSTITTVSQMPKSNIAANSLKLTSYDTRDAATLSVIPVLNNKFDNELCTDRCKAFSDNIPTSILGDGTDFIVIQVRNKSVDQFAIQSVQINGILHNWDGKTSGITFDASTDDSSGKYPLAGKFSIIPSSNSIPLTQHTSKNLNSDEEVRLIIKLSGEIQPDIGLGSPIEVLINFGSNQAAEYHILTGDTK